MKLESYPLSCKDSLGRLVVGAAVGIASDTMDRVEALLNMDVDVICIDTAHGHSKGVLDMVKSVRKTFKHIQIIAGNVATGEGALALANAGANAVKVGVGPGSICTTRVVAGVGVPQLTAISLAAHALAKKGIPVIGDGGIRYTGDIPKAIAAGAYSVMGGSLFAGTEEAPGETIIFEGRLPYKGKVSEVMVQYIGGLRASMGYVGAKTISDLQKAKMVRISNSGITESHPHNITITKESPNYSRR